MPSPPPGKNEKGDLFYQATPYLSYKTEYPLADSNRGQID